MSDINEKQNISRKEIQNVYTTLQDLYSYYSLELESISEYGYNSILKAFYNLSSVSYYQYFINIIFIILVFIILYILYRDIIYRNANNIKRCKILKNNINANMSYENPFVYNIYIPSIPPSKIYICCFTSNQYFHTFLIFFLTHQIPEVLFLS